MQTTKKLKQILVATALVTAGMLAIGGGTSKAALQANMTTHTTGKKYTGAALIQSIREMETTGQTMGLNEKLKDDLTPETSNGIDVHMMKSTEYGAMAILSASGFGWKGKLQDAPVKSTTGNVTGVYVTGNRWEWVAGICTDLGKATRYYDRYVVKDLTSAKVGDATGLDTYGSNPGCNGWHDSAGSWFDTSYYGLVRGGNGLFSFYGFQGNGSGMKTSWGSNAYCGRGVASVGAAL